MTKYSIYEKQNFHSRVAPSSSRKYSSLTVAKRAATREQVYNETVLVIVDERQGVQVAQKAPGDKWETAQWA